MGRVAFFLVHAEPRRRGGVWGAGAQYEIYSRRGAEGAEKRKEKGGEAANLFSPRLRVSA
jgi:hypothetical protein